MRRAFLLAAGALLASGCYESRLTPGAYKTGYAVEATGATVEEARRAAVASFFDLFLSSASAAANAGLLDKKILAKAGSYVLKEKREGKDAPVRLRALVAYTRLGKDLDALGLVRPEGVRGKPKVLIVLKESREEGRASGALRRALLARGYAAVDGSDPETLVKGDPKGAAKALGADVLVEGTAAFEADRDERLAGYASCRAAVTGAASGFPSGLKLVSLDQQASAVDVVREAACGKALDSAGELAGDSVHAALAAVYKERLEFTVAVLALGGLDRTRQLLSAIRALPPVAGAALDAADGKDVRLKLFVERMGADELTAQLLKLSEFKPRVRSVEPDFYYIELSSGEVF